MTTPWLNLALAAFAAPPEPDVPDPEGAPTLERFLATIQQTPLAADASAVQTPQLEPQRHPGEQYIADLPGVGGGLLDTLRTLYGKPLVFDTASADPGMLGEFQPRWKRGGQAARVLVNPRAMEGMDAEEIPTMLGHEVGAHGIGGVGPWAGHQEEGDDWGRALLALSGRTPTPLRKTQPYLDLQQLFNERLP